MICNINIELQSYRFYMMHIHTLVNAAAFFAFSTGAIFYFFFYPSPSISIFFLAVTSHPVWVFFTMQSIISPPKCRTRMRTKIVCLCSEISRWSSKCFPAIFTLFSSLVFWSLSSCRTFLIALRRTIFSVFFTNIAFKFFSTNGTLNNVRSLISSYSPKLTVLIYCFHNSVIAYINEVDNDYFDVDYFNAAKERFDRETRQVAMF